MIQRNKNEKYTVRIRKRELSFLGYIMAKEDLENWTLREDLEGKKSGGRRHLQHQCF